MTNRYLIPFFAALLALAAPAGAAERWFEVELIVFEHTGGGNREPWRLEKGLPEPRAPIELLPPAEGSGAPQPFQMLARHELTLTSVARLLGGAQSYRPLLHVGWRQPAGSGPAARPVQISGGGPLAPVTLELGDRLMDSPPQELHGTVRLLLQRFLHLDVDLTLYRPTPAAVYPGVEVYRMTERRRLRSKELHYFDHPSFGLLAMITPYQLPGEPEAPDLPEPPEDATPEEIAPEEAGEEGEP
jgi:hypothetical protein